MFFIFKIFPDWIWWLLPVLGLLGLFVSYLPQLKMYGLILKTLSRTTTAIGIFILGMLYSENAWNSATADLKVKVAELQIKSDTINAEIKEKLVIRTQVVKTRGDEVVKYIDREVTKSDQICIIPQEFVEAHNRAAELPK